MIWGHNIVTTDEVSSQGYTENTKKPTPNRHKPTMSYIDLTDVEAVLGVGVCRKHMYATDKLRSAEGIFDTKALPLANGLPWVVEVTGTDEGSVGTLTVGTRVKIIWRGVERPPPKAASHGSNSGDANEQPKSIAWVVEHLPTTDAAADPTLLVPGGGDNSKQFKPRLGASWQERAINPVVSVVYARWQLSAVADIYVFRRAAWVLPMLMGRIVRNLERNPFTRVEDITTTIDRVEYTAQFLARHDINLDESQREALAMSLSPIVVVGLVTGPSGTGKTETVIAMIDLNRLLLCRIILPTKSCTLEESHLSKYRPWKKELSCHYRYREVKFQSTSTLPSLNQLQSQSLESIVTSVAPSCNRIATW